MTQIMAAKETRLVMHSSKTKCEKKAKKVVLWNYSLSATAGLTSLAKSEKLHWTGLGNRKTKNKLEKTRKPRKTPKLKPKNCVRKRKSELKLAKSAKSKIP